MTMEAPTPELRFGSAQLDVEQRQLLIDGRPAKLGARAFDVLLALIERRDRAVSKNELFELVWPGVVVEENNLQVHISALRKLLGPQAIATIPGRGYRFTAAVGCTGDGPRRLPIAAETAPATAAATAAPTNLAPHHEPLYGRDDDALAVGELLRTSRAGLDRRRRRHRQDTACTGRRGRAARTLSRWRLVGRAGDAERRRASRRSHRPGTRRACR